MSSSGICSLALDPGLRSMLVNMQQEAEGQAATSSRQYSTANPIQEQMVTSAASQNSVSDAGVAGDAVWFSVQAIIHLRSLTCRRCATTS